MGRPAATGAIFLQNGARQQRGLADPEPEPVAWRSQRIIDRMRGVQYRQSARARSSTGRRNTAAQSEADDADADVAVVGGGHHRHAGRPGARDPVARGERSSWSTAMLVGCGASRRSAGLHLPRGATERVRRMAAYSQAYYDKLRETRRLPIHPLGDVVVARAIASSDCARLSRRAAYCSHGRRPESSGCRTGPCGAASGCQYADVYALTQALARGAAPGRLLPRRRRGHRDRGTDATPSVDG